MREARTEFNSHQLVHNVDRKDVGLIYKHLLGWMLESATSIPKGYGHQPDNLILWVSGSKGLVR